MNASLENPIYSAYIVSGAKKYNVTKALQSIDFSDRKNQFSKSATLHLVNVATGGSWLSSIIKVRDRVYIYADDGSKNEEVFRGFVWTRSYRSALTGHELQLRCYDNLIYMQESEDSQFFASGKSTKDVMQSICEAWGVSLEYSYESITHGKLALRGYLSDIIIDDILDLVKDRSGKKYVILSEKDTMQVKAVGSNTTVYTIQAGKNAIDTTSECTMDGMKTKVVILGKADKDDREPVEATEKGNTEGYGTIQKLIDRDSDTSLADAKKEAQNIIDEDGNPKWEYAITAPDIPWIRKGDKVKVSAGDIARELIVVNIDRNISNDGKKMELTLERVKTVTAATTDTTSTVPTENDKPNLSRVITITTPMMSGEDVTWLQKRLNALGYDCGDADGVYGWNTRSAVIKFQQSKGLSPDGQVGPLTWAEL